VIVVEQLRLIRATARSHFKAADTQGRRIRPLDEGNIAVPSGAFQVSG
jgi:hypothetical protein